MQCSKCNTPIEKDDVFCPNCGARIELQETSHPKKGKKWIMILVCLSLIAIIAAACLWFIQFKSEQKEAVSEVVNTEDKSVDDKVRLEDKKETAKTKETKEDAEGVDTPNESTEGEGISGNNEVLLSLTTKPTSTQPYYKLPVNRAGASSTVVQEQYDNEVGKMSDGLDETSWQEGVPGDGIGESVNLYFDGTYKVKYMSFKLGNWRGDQYYADNHRPKTLTIIAGNCSSMVTFPDGKEEYWVELSEECSVSEVKLIIKDVYHGSYKWDDTCISEVGIYGK